jgi:alginate O-acetyltransferase complex protein AlgI
VVFSSHLFAFYFLPLALLLYYGTPRRGRHLVLTLASYLFYGWANPAFMGLMLLSTLIDYFAGLSIAHGGRLRLAPTLAPLTPTHAGGERNRAQRVALVTSICSNLTLLAFFKYFDFAAESYNALVSLVGLDAAVWDGVLRVTLPLGISFYTFQSMSYTIDVYRGEARALGSFVDFACYVSMFPQLVAGPILRFSEVDDQLRHRDHTLDKLARGAAFFCLGMGKKVLLANPAGAVADAAFAAGAPLPLDAWTGVLAYAFQIYFDFSGYSDMAIGLGLMLGFTFPKNFDDPYRAESIADFWRRWHISLSSWLRDYLYIPLGGSRRGVRRTYVNLLVVMLLGGLWHGAAWNFVYWGAFHGTLLAVERARGGSLWPARLPRPLRVGATFGLVLLGWVLFRARDLGHAVDYYRAMAGALPRQAGAALLDALLYQPYSLLCLGAAAAAVWAGPQVWDWTQRLTPARSSACVGVLVVALVAIATQGYNPFIYFIF